MAAKKKSTQSKKQGAQGSAQKPAQESASGTGKKSQDQPRRDVFYVGIEDHKDVRKEVLASAKGVIVSLKRYEQIKENRKQKIEHLSQLRGIVKEINTQVGKLKNYMPETKLRELPVPEKQKSKKKSSAQKQKEKQEEKPEEKQEEATQKPTQPRSELERLDQELRNIEGKLKQV